MMVDWIVIGAGVFGRTIARALHLAGAEVVNVDRNEPRSGSRASGGLIKPSWFAGLPKGDFERATATLREAWGDAALAQRRFALQVGPVVKGLDDVLVLDMDRVLNADPDDDAALRPFVTRGDARVLDMGEGRVRIGEHELVADRGVVVAAGVWSGELLPVDGLHSKAGLSFTWREGRPTFADGADGLIRPWAPYKQVVVHGRPGGGAWAGDGTAILAGNWTDARTVATRGRIASAIGDQLSIGAADERIGYRPMIKGHKVAQLKLAGGRTWLATGGGKTGALGAGLLASDLLRATGQR